MRNHRHCWVSGFFCVSVFVIGLSHGCGGGAGDLASKNPSVTPNDDSVTPIEKSEDKRNTDPVRGPCGKEPGVNMYAKLARSELDSAMNVCADKTKRSLSGSRFSYLKVVRQQFPMGYGLEDSAKKCWASDEVMRNALLDAGICSDVASSMLILRCVREWGGSNCRFVDSVREYYSSESDSEWKSVLGDGLPIGVSVTRHGQRIPSEYAPIEEFISYLADRIDPNPYDVENMMDLDPEILGKYLDVSLVRFLDVNWGAPVSADLSRVQREGLEKSGATFVALTKLGWVYEKSGPQISRLEFYLENDRVTVSLSDAYEIEFRKSEDGFKMVKLSQKMFSDL